MRPTTVMSTIRSSCVIYIVSTVDGHGYDGQQKYTCTIIIYDACRLCQSILQILKQFLAKFDRLIVLATHSGG